MPVNETKLVRVPVELEDKIRQYIRYYKGLDVVKRDVSKVMDSFSKKTGLLLIEKEIKITIEDK